jgi:endonuclease/exonuclease/phosphatase family metal-dependent hydrolase
LGQTYIAAAVLPGLDVQLPSDLGFDVRLTDRDAIIVRKDLLDRGCQVTNLQEQDYLSQKVYTVSLLNAHVVERAGWVSFDLACGGPATRFVSTHLAFDENFSPATATAQANELLATAGQSNLRTVLVGDFNSDANNTDATFQTYQAIVNGGFNDAWNLAHGSTLSRTCCQNENLGNSSSKLSVRYDLVFVKGLTALDAKVVGDKTTDKTPSGLWPSDHAGVIATLR